MVPEVPVDPEGQAALVDGSLVSPRHPDGTPIRSELGALGAQAGPAETEVGAAEPRAALQ